MRNAHFVMVALVGLGACSDSPASPRSPALDAVNDPNLAASLRTLTSDRNRSVRLAAIQGIGKLHRTEDRALLEALQKDPDATVVVYATDGIDELRGFTEPGATAAP